MVVGACLLLHEDALVLEAVLALLLACEPLPLLVLLHLIGACPNQYILPDQFNDFMIRYLELVSLGVGPLVEKLFKEVDCLGILDENLGLSLFELCRSIDFSAVMRFKLSMMNEQKISAFDDELTLTHPFNKGRDRCRLRISIYFGTDDAFKTKGLAS